MYARKIDGNVHTFGVSGLLYRSNVLMYDHQTESLWLQVKRRAVTGPMTGTKLFTFPSTRTTWKKWKKKHPETTVLSFNTGHNRNYDRDPYESYYRDRRGMFSSFFKAGPGEEEKELVAGLEIAGKTKAWPMNAIRSTGTILDELGGTRLTIRYDDRVDSVTITDGSGKVIEPVIVYWFVWKGIQPDSGLYRPE